jgi:bifunctional non-homologous end joining protein LigD
MPRFVVQEHHARTHHFDFRLEKEGVYKSWAVPKGIPKDPGVKRLAVQVDDHDLSFGDFQGQIPEGQYGAGEVRIWDKGTYDVEEWTDARIAFTLHGDQAGGRFDLIRFKKGKPNEWLIIKRS